jgi:stage V sporulation protein D (sporulation-specific penicillin-binding protein)
MSKSKGKKTSPLRKAFSHKSQKKLVFLFYTIILAFVLLIAYITHINAKNGEKYTKIVLDQQQYNSRVIPFKRGDILDRNGTVIATSERVYNVILDAYVMMAKDDKTDKIAILQVKDALEECFEIDSSAVDEVVEKKAGSRYNIMKKKVSYADAQKFKVLLADKENYEYLSCVWLEEDYIRTYPYSTLAADVIGFTVSGNVGNAGIEASYNSILNGTNGREYGYQDADAALERTVKNAINGQKVVSTLDVTLQSIVEKHILAFNEEHKNEYRSGEGSKNTAVIIMNPNTAEILAEASYPTFDLNHPRDLSKFYSEETIAEMKDEEKLTILNKIWRNFCVSDTFEAGSTIKPFTMASAFEDGTLHGGETYDCTGYRVVAGQRIRCNNRNGHGIQTLSDGIANSCNVVLMEVAARMGATSFCKYQKVFNFGQKTGIDLPGEADTVKLVYQPENMGPVELATNSFGQGFNVTMTQMVAGFSSIINGGNYYEPHVVRQIQDENGNVVENKNPVLIRKTISEETSDIMRKYMKQTMTDGTGRNAQVAGYSMGGKTGTAEKLPRGNGKYVLSFMGFAPVDSPEVLVYVVIDEPNVEHQSTSKLVTDLARNIMEEAFPYLNITKEEMAN